MNKHEALDPAEFRDVWSGEWMEKLCQHSLLEGKGIGWNYIVDYPWVLKYLDKVLEGVQKEELRSLKIVDIGCGPGAIHGFIENYYGINVIGVDLKRWKNGDYVDYVGDFTDRSFRKANGLNEIDIIISSSAFEHNSPVNHYALVRECLKALKLNGYLITTSSISTSSKTNNVPATQYNLGTDDIALVYGSRPDNEGKLSEIIQDWATDTLLNDRFYGRYDARTPRRYVSYGVFLKNNFKLPNTIWQKIKLMWVGARARMLR